MQFIDHTEILVRSGHGGRGMVSFRCGRHVPKAGADGGDGGHGGDVYLIGCRGMNTLSHLRYRQQYYAENGEKGGSNSRTGRSGEDLVLKVPLGTIALRADTGEKIGEVLEHDETLLLAKGGKRGIGNERFLSATHQAPEEYTPGGRSEEFVVKLELKLLADIGFAGFPNAGKSTLLSVVSAAKPKVADYPFTTLTPQLGVVDVDPNDLVNPLSYVAADIPGLIEGAAEGRGLGHEFLKHLERTRVVAYILDPFTQDQDVETQYETLSQELQKYNPELAQKPATVVITKMDLADDSFDRAEIEALFRRYDLPVLFVSSATHMGLQTLKRQHFDFIQQTMSDGSEIAGLSEQSEVQARPQLSDFQLNTSNPLQLVTEQFVSP